MEKSICGQFVTSLVLPLLRVVHTSRHLARFWSQRRVKVVSECLGLINQTRSTELFRDKKLPCLKSPVQNGKLDATFRHVAQHVDSVYLASIDETCSILSSAS